MGMIAYLREVSDDDLRGLDDPGRAHALFRRDEPGVLSLEKSWDGLHFLLTGSADRGTDSLGFLMSGGREIGANLGYGRPRLLPPDYVQSLHTALAGISDDQLWGRFDAQRMEAEGIYPLIWDEPPDDLRDEYLTYFHDLRDFVARVAASGGQLLVAIV
jgi:hypothetical protein